MVREAYYRVKRVVDGEPLVHVYDKFTQPMNQYMDDLRILAIAFVKLNPQEF